MPTLLDLLQLLESLFLGFIQGVSEWLPISSTAHLRLAETFLGLAVTPLFNLVLHLGTLTVVVFFFREDIRKILVALVRRDFKSESGMLVPRIVVALIPTAIIGITYDLFLENSLSTILAFAVTFLIGATIVYSTKFTRETAEGLSYGTVLLMGTAQGFSVFSGLSRSGVTISTALLLGQKRETAFKFSFLLSIPAIIGDLGFETYRQRGLIATTGISSIDVIAAFAVAVVAGYFAIKLVVNFVRGKKFHYFAFYTWALGIALLIWTFIVH